MCDNNDANAVFLHIVKKRRYSIMNIVKKRKFKSIVAVLCVFVLIFGIVPGNIWVNDTVSAANNVSGVGDTLTVKANLYDYFTDEEINGQSITTSSPSGYQDPYTMFNTAISGGNTVTVYFDNPKNWYTVRIYAWNTGGELIGGWSSCPSMSYSETGITYGGVTYKYSYTFSVTGNTGDKINIILYDNNNGASRYEYRGTVQIGKINYCKGVYPGENEGSSYAPQACVESPVTMIPVGLTDPLYFGTFFKGANSSDYTANTAPAYNNFYWAANITQRNQYDSSLRGLVSDTLQDGTAICANNGVVLPYFNSEWLADTNVGTSYKNLDFTFKKNGEYYYFDSSKAEFGYYYDKVSQNVLMGSDYATYNEPISGSNGYGFFPFDTDTTDRNGGAKANPALNMGFGMNFDVEFKLPEVVADTGSTAYSTVKDKVKDKNGRDVVFNFRGDDDVWVYVDGKLALDIGGAHSKAGGSINFTKGKVRLYNSIDYASNKNTIKGEGDTTILSAIGAQSSTWQAEKEAGYVQWDISGSESETVYYVEYSFDQLGLDISATSSDDNGYYYKGYDGSTHKIQFFYMERGMIESNLYASFNFAAIEPPQSSFTIAENTTFDNVNPGLKTRTMEAANLDVFNYKITNQGTTDAYLESVDRNGNGGLLYPYIGSTVLRSVKNGDEEIADTRLSVGEQLILQYTSPTNYTNAITAVHLHVYLQDSAGNQLPFTNFPDSDRYTSSADWFGWDKLDGEYVEMTKGDDGVWKVDLASCSTETAAGKTFSEFYAENKESYPNIYVKMYGIEIPGWTPVYFDSYLKNVQIGYRYVFDESASSDFTWGYSWVSESLPEIETITGNFTPTDSTVLSPVSGVNFVRSDSYSPASVVGRTSDDGVASLMFSQEAYFLKQFEDNSILTVEQSLTLAGLTTDENEVAVLTSPTSTGRNAADYYNTSWRLTDAKDVQIASGKGTTVSDGDSTDSFKFANSAATQTSDAGIPVMVKADIDNEVRTGVLKITKKLADEKDTYQQEFSITLKLTDMLGQSGVDATTGDYVNYSVEGIDRTAYFGSDSTTEIKLKAGQTAIITGISVGTRYTISENTQEDFELKSIVVTNSAGETDTSGTISEGDESTAPTATVTNERKVGTLSLKKELKDETGGLITSGDDYTDKEFIFDVTLTSDDSFAISPYYLNNTIKVKNGTDEVVTTWTPEEEGKKVIASIKVKAGDSIVIEGIPYGSTYSVSEINIPDGWKQERATSVSGQIDSTNPNCTATITNKKLTTTNIKITKVDAENTGTKLSDVEFKLEKMQSDGASVDESFVERTDTTKEDGMVTFSDLEDGIYRITETKATTGYYLLKEPIIVVIDRTNPNGCMVDGNVCTVTDNTISLTVSNRLKFAFPLTGGYGVTIISLAGILLIGMAGFIYITKKQRS